MVPKTTTDPRFYAALQQSFSASMGGPTNSSVLLKDKDVVLQKAASLASYQSYLAQARTWKASRKSVPLSFERQVQAQAAQALSDTRNLAAATLRMTSQMKQAGYFDRLLSSLIAGVQAGGPAQISDLWAHVTNDSSARQVLRDQGLTDDLFATINDAKNKMDGQILLQDGKLAINLNVVGQSQVRSAVFRSSPVGPPASLHDLLTRGQFERVVEQFGKGDALPLGIAPGVQGELELPDVLAAGAIQSVLGVAQHKRKLEDTGLATYEGADPLTISLIAATAWPHTNRHWICAG